MAAFVGVWILMSAAAIGFQSWGGAYESDFGSHPDEASHFVTGLMVRDYLLGGIPRHPMRFAEDYYAHYPKVALGHYPPGFYLAEGLWLSVFPVSRWSILAFMAVQSGLLGALVFSVSKRRTGGVAAVLAGAFVVALPLTQTLAAAVMSDLLLSLACFLAALAFIRYLESARWQDSLRYGIWVMAATMVKGSGLFLALLVPIAILISWRWELLKKPGLWISGIPVISIAGPWIYFTRGITAEGMVEVDTMAHLASVVPYFASEWMIRIGWTLSVLSLVALLSAFFRRQLRADPLLVGLVSFPLALVLFYAVVPAGLDTRYLMPLVAPAAVLAALGVREIAAMFKSVPSPVPAILLFGLAAAEMVRLTEKRCDGWDEIAERISEAGGPTDSVLVVSDARGEGALISELAMRDADRPSRTVVRGSKELGPSDWLGRGYEERFKSAEELAGYLRQKRYLWVVVDPTMPELTSRSYHRRARQLFESGSDLPYLIDAEITITRQYSPGGVAALYRIKPEPE